MATSNRVVILSASEEEIIEMGDVCCAFVHFYEPDLGDSCTAIAIMPCHLAEPYLSSLPLHKGKEVRK